MQEKPDSTFQLFGASAFLSFLHLNPFGSCPIGSLSTTEESVGEGTRTSSVIGQNRSRFRFRGTVIYGVSLFFIFHFFSYVILGGMDFRCRLLKHSI